MTSPAPQSRRAPACGSCCTAARRPRAGAGEGGGAAREGRPAPRGGLERRLPPGHGCPRARRERRARGPRGRLPPARHTPADAPRQAPRRPRAATGKRAGALLRAIALAAAPLALASGCALVPGRFVEERTAPPEDVAREAAAAAPVRAAAPEGPPAPPPPAPTPRSLADLVDLALSRDPATRAVWHDARAAAAQAGAVRSLYLPSLEASLAAVRQRMGESPSRPAFTQTTLGASASLTWLLFDLGARGALVEESDRLLAAARLAEHSAVADLVLRVQESYFEYLASRALVEAEAAAVRQAEASLAAAESRRAVGLATIADVLQARTALSQVRLELQQAEGQSLVVRGGLATLVGLPPTAELEVGRLPAEIDAGAIEPAVEDLLATAAARNPDLGAARASAEAAAARARAASRATWPVLALQAGASRSHFLDPDVDPDTTTSWNVGLVLRLPLFEGLRPAYDALAAQASADAARARADATAQRVALDVWTAWQTLRTAGQRVVTARDLVASAEASAEVATGRYKEGVGSIIDLLNAQAALELARSEDVRARTDWLIGLARLARSTGRLDLPPPPGLAPEGPEGP